MNEEQKAELIRVNKEARETLTWMRLSQNMITQGEYADRIGKLLKLNEQVDDLLKKG